VSNVDAAPASLPPIDAIAAALGTAADDIFEVRRDLVRQRQAIIDANPELQERELRKLASLARPSPTRCDDGCRRPCLESRCRGRYRVFKIAFEDWIHGAGERTLSDGIRASVDELRRVTGRQRPAARR